MGCGRVGASGTTVMEKVDRMGEEMRKGLSAIEAVEDPATGFTMNATCTSVCKAAYMLRLTGDLVTDVALNAFDQKQMDSLGHSLGGEVSAAAWTQAQCRLEDGGRVVRGDGRSAQARDLQQERFPASLGHP